MLKRVDLTCLPLLPRLLTLLEMKKYYVWLVVVLCLFGLLVWGLDWLSSHSVITIGESPPQTEAQICSELGNVDMRYLPAKCLKYFK